MVEDYYWQTGETEHIREYRSVIDGILEWFDKHMGKSGLIENLGYWPFVDWVEGWDRGVPPAEKGRLPFIISYMRQGFRRLHA